MSNDTIETYVEDIITIRRPVELPRYCINCGVSLEQGRSIKLDQYTRNYQYAHIIDDGMEWGSTHTEEQDIRIRYRCAECNHVLASNKERKLDAEKLSENNVITILLNKLLEKN
jgi:hypothetical protein